MEDNEYGYSEEKYQKLLTDMGISNELIKEGSSDNTDDTNSILEETINEISVYIRNYDADGNLLDSPLKAVKTCIDTFEKEIVKTTWNVKEYVKDIDGEQKLTNVKHENIVVTSDDSIFADPEILKVKPHTIDGSHFINSFIKEYLQNFNITKNEGGKTLYIEFHTTKDDKFYSLTYDDIAFYISKNYDIIGLNLDNRTLTIDSNKILELITLSLENLVLEIKTDTGFSVKAKNIYFESLKIDSQIKDALGSINLTVTNEVKISYIDFVNDICKFDLLNTNRENMQMWMMTSAEIYGIDFIKDNVEYEYPIETIFKFDGFYNVKFNSVNMYGKTLNMNFIKFVNVTNITMGSLNITFEEFKKHPIVAERITSLTACGVYFTQNSIAENDLYTFYITNAMIMGEIKFTSVISQNLGLVGALNNASDSITFYASRSINHKKPLKWIGNSVGKVIFSSCHFDTIDELDLNVPKISMFDSRFNDIETFNITVGEKLYLSKTSISGKKLNLVVTDDGKVVIDECKINFINMIRCTGDKGTGNFNSTKTSFITEELKYESMNRIASENSEYEIKILNIVGNNINKFNPILVKSRIKEINVSGKIKNCLFMISDSSKNKVKYNFTSCQGNANIFYDKEIFNSELTVDSSVINLTFDTAKEANTIDDAKITFKYLNECIGSSLTSYNYGIKFSPIPEGSFTELKYFDDYNVNLKKSEWKEKISYGYTVEK